MVTHDRAFLDRVCTGILSIEEGEVVSYADRSQVLRAATLRRQEEQAALQAEKEALQAKAPKVTQKKSGLSYKEKRELEALPDHIETLEQQLADIDDILLDPATYTNPEIRVSELQSQKEVLESEIEQAMERWEELSEKALE